MRTQEEIFEYIRTLATDPERDIFGNRVGVLFGFASVDTMKKVFALIKSEEDIEGQWKQAFPLEESCVMRHISERLNEAWGYIVQKQGSSAFSSVVQIEVLLWLLGDDELVDFFTNEQNYGSYGMPMLQRLCAKYGFACMFNSSLGEA